MDSTSDNQSFDEIPEATLLSHNESLRPIVGIFLAITVVLATGYLIALVIEENPFGVRPTSEALEAQSVYQDLVQIDEVSGDGTGVKVCIVDSGIDTSHPDLSSMNLVAWQDFVANQDTPYDDQGHGTSMAGILVGDGYIEGVAPNVFWASSYTSVRMWPALRQLGCGSIPSLIGSSGQAPASLIGYRIDPLS